MTSEFACAVPRLAALFLVLMVAADPAAQGDGAPPREVLPGLSTSRIVYGKPYELAGKRLVFTNWHYVNPGDLDWRTADGKSVYVKGDVRLYDAHHIGANAPSGIKIRAERPNVLGPMDNMPYRTILKDGDTYKGWTSTEYMESRDGLHWEIKGKLNSDEIMGAFIDPSAPSAERFKSVWTDEITHEQFDAFRAKRPDGWEPRAVVHLAENGPVTCVRGAVSADGIQWTVLPDPLVVEYSDTFDTCYYDPVLRKYVLYTRYWSLGPTS